MSLLKTNAAAAVSWMFSLDISVAVVSNAYVGANWFLPLCVVDSSGNTTDKEVLSAKI